MSVMVVTATADAKAGSIRNARSPMYNTKPSSFASSFHGLSFNSPRANRSYDERQCLCTAMPP